MRTLAILFLALFSTTLFAQKTASDDAIYDQVRQRLANDRDVKGGGIQVDVKAGVVTLSGTVREERQKSKAERVARKVKGVKQVVNNLKVEMPVGRSSLGPAQDAPRRARHSSAVISQISVGSLPLT